jgi:ribosomal protein S18 acetylase RimI-like enzyme
MNLTVSRLTDPNSQDFDALIAIYSAAHPASELKPVDLLVAMARKPEYLFLTASLDRAIVGFAILCMFPQSNAAHLEYMAVAEPWRGQGIGRSLFRQIAEMREISTRSLIVEVDSDKLPSPSQAGNTRRKLFYRSLGCKEVAGLHYLMPPVSSSSPPPIDLMVYRNPLADKIAKAQLREWLQAIYVNIYSVPASDLRIDRMLDQLPQDIDLM